MSALIEGAHAGAPLQEEAFLNFYEHNLEKRLRKVWPGLGKNKMAGRGSPAIWRKEKMV